MLFPYLLAYYIDSIIYLIFLGRDVCLYVLANNYWKNIHNQNIKIKGNMHFLKAVIPKLLLMKDNYDKQNVI